jgi:hypothetical protein
MYRHTRADGTRDILKVADYEQVLLGWRVLSAAA